MWEKDRRVIIQANIAVMEMASRLTPTEQQWKELLVIYSTMLKEFEKAIKNFMEGYRDTNMTPDEYIQKIIPRKLTDKEENWLLFNLNPVIEHLSQEHHNWRIVQEISEAHDILCKFKSADGYSSYLENDQPKRKLKLFVWTDFCPNYEGGLAFAVAENEAEARVLIMAHPDVIAARESHDWGKLSVHNLDEKVAFLVNGGA